MAALLVLAGCAGPVSNGTNAPVVGDTPDGETTVGSDGGTVEFYVSDERNAIGDFAHLNVTVTKVGFHRTGGDGDDAEGTETDDPVAPDDPTESTVTELNGTTTASPTASATPSPGEDVAGGAEADGGESEARWVEYDVNATVDLTELQGANATKLGALAAPNGSYDRVFVYVSEIDATLESGEQVNVKLPSDKLQLNEGFTVGDGRNVSFVFDMTVFEAGNSGKYILKPVVSQSGTGEEVAIEDVGEKRRDDRGRDDDGERDEDGGSDEVETNGSDDHEADEAEPSGTERRENVDSDAASDLAVAFVGPVEAGSEATLQVTGADGPVANATVEVNGERVGRTDGSGTIALEVPEDAEEVEVTVTKGDAEVEVTRDLAGREGSGAMGPLA